jgi:6-phosphogluconate dehydrogenase
MERGFVALDRTGGTTKPVPTITASLFARFPSRRDTSCADRLLAALRNEFGGHAVHR